MANRYWVGGTGSWSSTNTANWAASSGGASGATVPTGSDDVFFDANSNVGTGAFTVTMANSPRVCADIIVSGLDGTMTLAGSGIGLTVFNNLEWPATNFIRTYNGTTTFATTNTGRTVTTNGVAFGGTVIFDGVGGEWTLGSALTNGSGFTTTLTNGTLSLSSYTLSIGAFTSTNSNIRTINFGTGQISCTGSSNVWITTNTTNLTITGTGTINLTSASAKTFVGGSFSYSSVTLNQSGAGALSITGSNTFNNLSVTGPATAGVVTVTFAANQTINSTLSTTSTAGNRRVFFASATYGIGFTLTVANKSLTDADFRDLYIIGAGTPLTGTRIGNRGNCSGITFSTPKTVYWNLAGSNNWDANAWALSSSGGVSTDNFPLPQDTAIIDNANPTVGNTISIGTTAGYLPNVDFSSRTVGLTFSANAPVPVYGNWANGSGITIGVGLSALTFSGGTTQTITSAGKTFLSPITVDTYGGTVQLTDALDIGSNTLTVTNGTFTTAGFAVTAGALSSSNSNVRTINLGASTVSLSSFSTFINFTTSTNLTFNSGTSTIVHSVDVTGGISPQLGSLTYYNLTLSNASSSTLTYTLNGQNTFNNLTLSGTSASANIQILSFTANTTINGTLTCAGASAVKRISLQSNTVGTQRTLTVNSLSADDCDFRDIVIAGTASGSSPTRAGDCGNNSGITFPVAKTVYWNLAGTRNWSATGWCAASGGTPAVNNFPLAQDTAVFDNTGSAGTVIIDTTWNIGTFDASLRTSAMTFNTSALVPVVYGNWLFGTGITSSSTTGAITFAKNGTQTITSNGVQFGCPITINNLLATVQLADALSLNSARAINLTAGTFDAVTYNITTGAFSNGSTSNTLKMGSGTWTLSGTGTVWDCTTAPTIIAGTSNIVLSDTSTGVRTFTGGGLYYNKLTIGGATGISTLTVSGNNTFGELASTKTVAHTIDFGTSTQIFGKWSVTGTAGNVVTITGTSTTNVIAGPAFTGVDYLAMGTWGISTTSPGEFYAGANSTGTAAAPVFRTAAPAPRTLYWVGGTGNWSSTTKWSTSSGGASGAAIPTSLDSVNFDSLSNATAYTATIDAGVALARCAAFSMAGPLVGNVTWAGTVGIAFHGNVSFAATGITRSYTGGMNWAGNSSYTFTTNGLGLGGSATVVGIGSTWTLGSAFTMQGILTVTYGTFDTSAANNYAFSPNTISSGATNVRTINLNASTGTLNAGGVGITFTSTTNLTFNAGTSQINLGGSSTTITCGTGQTFYNVSLTSGVITTAIITGANTFNNLTIAAYGNAGIGTITFSANQIINGTLTLTASPQAASRTFLASNTIGTTRTLTVGTLTAGATDIDFRDITIAGAAAPISGTRFGDCGGNSGITFPAAKTVYYRQTGSADWGVAGSGSWSLTSGGAFNATAFPLAQDTAVFPATSYPGSTATTTFNASYNIGTIDMSLRTSNTMVFSTGTTTPQIYGNWINGTGITISGTGAITFTGRGSQTITSAGKTFAQSFIINSPSGSLTLQDALTNSNNGGTAISHQAGTFSLNSYTITLSGNSGFSSSASAIRTLNFGTNGVLSLLASGFNASTSTNLTVTGTGTVNLNSASAKSFTGGTPGVNYSGITLNQGGAGTLTISGNNTFANITNTAVGATTINLQNTTQTVGAFTATGTSGNLLTITGTSAASPATLVYTGIGIISTVDYLVPTSIRVYPTTSTWFAGANSTNGGSLGWIFSVGGAVIYNVFFIDTATATDSPSVAASTFNAPISETATATDSPSVAASTFNAPVEETATATDSGVGFILFPVSITETATATDSDVGFILFPALITETATATDSVISFADFYAAMAETATATDSLLVAPSTFNAPVAETATATDSPSVAASTFNAPVTETATATDLILGRAAFSSALSETVTATDLILGLAAFSSALSETATATDSVLSFADFYAALVETATATDSPLVAPSIFNVPVAETATATDSPLVAPSTFNAPVSETVTISDLVLGLYLWNLIDDSQSVTWQNINSSPGTTWSPIDTDPDTGWSVIPTVN